MPDQWGTLHHPNCPFYCGEAMYPSLPAPQKTYARFLPDGTVAHLPFPEKPGGYE